MLLPEKTLLGYLGDMTLHGAMVVGNRPVEINKELTLSIEFSEIPHIPDTTLPSPPAWRGANTRHSPRTITPGSNSLNYPIKTRK